MNVFHFLDSTARKSPEAPAIYLGQKVLMNYRDLRDRALRLASALSRLSETKRIAICTANCPEYLEIMFGTWGAGLTVVPINAKLHAREISDIISAANADIAFCSAKIAGALAPDPSRLARLVVVGGNEYQRLLNQGAHDWSLANPYAEIAWIFYTSGTTGKPKGALLTHKNLASMAITFLAEVESARPSHSLLHAAPMSHGSGLYSIPYVLRGASHIIPKSGGFIPEELLDCASRHPYCAAFLAPTMVHRLLNYMEEVKRTAPSLQAVIYGGGPMHLPTIKRALRLLGPNMIQIYGQGEAPMTISVLRREEHMACSDQQLVSVGWPQAGVEVRIVDSDDRELPDGEAGEIVCRGDVVMEGYLDDPTATSATLLGGWLHTGDLGFREPSRRICLVGRVKELIITGGSNVYPREVEDVLLQHESVDEICVTGRADAEWGEKVIAFIVSTSAGNIDRNSLDEWCKGNLARFKRPREYYLVSSLPKNSSGKVLRNDLLELLSTGLEAL